VAVAVHEEDLKIAELSDDEVARVRALEEELGENIVILAYDKPLSPARLTEEQVARVMEVEAEMGHSFLVAYRKPRE
jgi:hypothetical protein